MQYSYVLSAILAFSTDDMLVRTKVKILPRRPTTGKCFGLVAHPALLSMQGNMPDNNQSLLVSSMNRALILFAFLG